METSQAEFARALLLKRKREYIVAHGHHTGTDLSAMPPVTILPIQHAALILEWDPIKDGSIDGIVEPTPEGYYLWRDVPFVVGESLAWTKPVITVYPPLEEDQT
jgi:hypothetical protein